MRATLELGLGKKLIFASATVLLFFAVFEGAARLLELVRPPLEVDYGLGFDSQSRLFAIDPTDPALRATRPSKRRFFLDQKFSAEKPPGAIRIAALGGSSVRFLDSELRAMARRVEATKGLVFGQVEIINAGGLAYGTHRLVPILSELLEYDLDLVLLYSGHNEFEEVEQLTLSRQGAAQLERGLASLAFFRLLRDGLTAARVVALESAHNQRLLSEVPAQVRAWNHPFSPKDVAERMSAYRSNLEIMIQLCRKAGVPLIIGTVPSNLHHPVLPASNREAFAPVFTLYAEGRYEEAVALARVGLRNAVGRHQSSDIENEIIRDLADAYGVALADIERKIVENEPHGVPGETLFRDHCHLNERGNRLWAKAYLLLVLELIEAG